MHKMTLFFFILISLTAYGAEQNKEHWAAPPKEILFKEFKFMKTVNKTGAASTFVHQMDPYFKLTKPFNGNQTKICYGSSSLDPKTKSAMGIACVLEATGSNTCAEVDFQKCSDDQSIEVIK